MSHNPPAFPDSALSISKGAEPTVAHELDVTKENPLTQPLKPPSISAVARVSGIHLVGFHMSESYPPEEVLLAELRRHDGLLLDFQRGALGLEEFRGEYGNFYWELALDGHESDDDGLLVLGKHHRQIARHRIISEEAISLSVPPERASQIIIEQASHVLAGEI